MVAADTGRVSSVPGPESPASGYLIQDQGYTLLLDLGHGAFGALQRHIAPTAVDAIVISHLHADHFIDLVPYSYALSYSPHPCAGRGRRPELHVPPGAVETLRRVTGAWNAPDLIEQAFRVHEYDPEATLELGPLRIAFREVPHFVRTHAVQIADGRATFTFGADCAPNDGLVEFAQGTDLLMLESTLDQPETAGPGPKDVLHLGAAGQLRHPGRREARCVRRADDATHAHADHKIDWQSKLLNDLEDADVREATRPAAAQHQRKLKGFRQRAGAGRGRDRRHQSGSA